MTQPLQTIIEEAFNYLSISNTSFEKIDNTTKKAVTETINLLDSGQIRIAEKKNGQWTTHQWLKKAVLLSFLINENKLISAEATKYYDKIALKFADYSSHRFKQECIRVVPSAVVRKGAYIAPNAILMPSYVNIGAYIDEETMVDTWATVGSCAQIGKRVHLSGGVGIGGVLEPLQANPTIIEDDCFIGARSEIAEGVIIEQGSVISMGVFIGQSTRIYDRTSGQIHYGRVPAGSVVVAGNLPAQNGSYSLYSAIIVKKVDGRTQSKVAINELLRSIN